MPFSVTRKGADPVILAVSTVLAQLSPDTDVFELIAGIKRREQVAVRFADGSEGIVASLEPLVDPTGGQKALALTEPPKSSTYEVECKLVVAVPLNVVLEARTRQHAETIVRDVFRAHRPVPSDMEIDFNQTSMVATFTRLDEALASSNMMVLRDYRLVLTRSEEVLTQVAS